jgi:hypothetical protein
LSTAECLHFFKIWRLWRWPWHFYTANHCLALGSIAAVPPPFHKLQTPNSELCYSHLSCLFAGYLMSGFVCWLGI